MQIGSVKLRALDIAIIVLTLITAVIHLSLGGPMFILNGLGYLTLLIVYFLPALAKWHGWIRWLFIGYTLLTIILYFVFSGGESFQNSLGLVTKAVELVLLVLLFLDRGQKSA